MVRSPDHSTSINSSCLVIRLSKGSSVCLCSCMPLYLSLKNFCITIKIFHGAQVPLENKTKQNKSKLICFPPIHQDQTLCAYPTSWGTDNQCTSGLWVSSSPPVPMVCLSRVILPMKLSLCCDFLKPSMHQLNMKD